jgi:hypothetical protein
MAEDLRQQSPDCRDGIEPRCFACIPSSVAKVLEMPA